jgi:replicative DNA helicase
MDLFLEKVQTEAYKPYQTGIAFFDELLGGGVIQQSLLLLMAAPATGKTTLCQQIAEEMAARKKPVIYLNFEMSREQMIAKAISGRLSRKGKTKTATDILQGYRWSAEDKEEITNEINSYQQEIYPFIKYNPDNIGSNIEDITDYLHNIGEAAADQREQAPAVIIDYLHLITSEAGKDVQELIKQTMVVLKDYAMKYNTFVICIVATNRVSNKTGKLSMESGRDSSSIEYTGDYQLTLNYYDIDSGKVSATDQEEVSKLQRAEYRKMILRLHKNRLGVSGKKATLLFNAAQNTFYGEYDFTPEDLKEIYAAFEDEEEKEEPDRTGIITL